MKLGKLIFLIVLSVIQNLHAQQKFCLESDIQIPFFSVANPATTFSNLKINQQINEKQIIIDNRKKIDTISLFAENSLVKGDCILFNPNEEVSLNIKKIEDDSPWYGFITGANQKENINLHSLIPVIVYKLIDKSRAYGYLETKNLDQLTKKELIEISTKELLDHPLQDKIIVIYIICDKERSALAT